MGMVEAVDFPPSAIPAEWLHHYDEPIRLGYARRTVVLPDTHWEAVT
jgi:hypothetical protein